MTVKWIGDAARELGLTPLDAVEVLASRQEYPMNGLLDEDRFKTLRLMRGGKRLEVSGSQPMPVPERPGAAMTVPIPAPPPASHPAAPAPPHPAPVVPAPPPARPPVGEATSVTSPMPSMPAREGERTVILPPIDPKR